MAKYKEYEIWLDTAGLAFEFNEFIKKALKDESDLAAVKAELVLKDSIITEDEQDLDSRAAEVKSLTDKLAAARGQVETINTDYVRVSNELADTDVKVERLREALRGLWEFNAEPNRQVIKCADPKLYAELAALLEGGEEMTEDSRKALEDAKARIFELEMEVSKVKKEFDECLAQYSDMKANLLAAELEFIEAEKILDRLREQNEKLGMFIIREVPGEPSQDEGAIDTAIRIIRKLMVEAK